jgi:acetylornithine deacetylase/succinyl-diaminopimelate desuccinylase-like protein
MKRRTLPNDVRVVPDRSSRIVPFLVVAALGLGASVGLSGSEESGDAAMAAAHAYRETHAARIVRDYADLLAVPNASDDPQSLRANAERIRDELAARGVEAGLWTLPDVPEAAPVVYGTLASPGATRTLGVYVHYDGQPVDPPAWTATEPWEPALYTGVFGAGGERIPFPKPGQPIDGEWRLYARSAGDDKVPLPAIFAALDALSGAGLPRTSNIVFFFEGEEESGSTHLGSYMEAHREELAVDAWLICDGPVHQSRRPQLVFGVRGITALDITVYGPTRALHSGHYGNWAPNPAMELARLLASMKAENGAVLVDGFYESTVPPGAAERKAMASIPDFADELRRELGLAATEADNAALAERLLVPSLNIKGFVSAAVGEAARNLIPAEATAAIDIRLVKGNDPDDMLDVVEAHIRAAGFHIVREDPDLETRLAHPKIARVNRRGGYPAARTAMNLPVVEDVIAAARRAAGDELVLLPTLGGSLPLYLFNDLLAAPVVIVPMANHDNNQHAPDENLRLANLFYGIDLMAALFTMD